MSAQNAGPVPLEIPAVAPNEALLRRVPPHWYPDPDVPQKPQWLAFKPTADDKDGLSLGRRCLIASVEDFSYTLDRAKRRSVAQVFVLHVHGMRLTVEPAPLMHDRSHAVIPEMNIRDYTAGGAQKRAIKEWALRLAHECAEMVLVLPTAQAE
jgi:hypothetical protein